jgi:RIO-like serine/threonine protein kinase
MHGDPSLALTLGTRLGVYEVGVQIGVGGMGEVYRARDTKLDRDVAIKVLPEAFTHDADRLARFQREAKTLASLNHPHIAAIYGFEKSAGMQALVLELVEGPTLADRIAKGPIPLDDALPIARQIAEALEAAHEKGVIHRELKPANVKVTRAAPPMALRPFWRRALPIAVTAIAAAAVTMTIGWMLRPLPPPLAKGIEAGPASIRSYDIMPDGRLIGVVNAGQPRLAAPAVQQINVVLNWQAELKRMVPTR